MMEYDLFCLTFSTISIALLRLVLIQLNACVPFNVKAIHSLRPNMAKAALCNSAHGNKLGSAVAAAVRVAVVVVERPLITAVVADSYHLCRHCFGRPLHLLRKICTAVISKVAQC